MIAVTEKAAREIKRVFESQGKPDGLLRVYVSGGGCSGLSYGMAIEDTTEDGDQVFQENGVQIVVDPKSYMYIAGAKIDWATDQLMGGGFKIENPNPIWSEPLAQGVQELIDTQINPGVASHGGHVELLDVKENRVFVRMGGGCQGCGMASVTLKQGVEALLRQSYPEVEVIDTTDHAGGTNPFYQPAKGAPGASPFHQPAKG
jgi:Fe/S biogenesis protein NfuA